MDKIKINKDGLLYKFVNEFNSSKLRQLEYGNNASICSFTSAFIGAVMVMIAAVVVGALFITSVLTYCLMFVWGIIYQVLTYYFSVNLDMYFSSGFNETCPTLSIITMVAGLLAYFMVFVCPRIYRNVSDGVISEMIQSKTEGYCKPIEFVDGDGGE